MSYFANCYTYDDMNKIIKSVVQEYEEEFGKPDKVLRCYFDTHEHGLMHFINQTRIYINAKKIVFITDNSVIIIPFEKIIGYEVVNPKENNRVLTSATTTVTKTDTGDMIKRAVIGGVLGGGVGALIGGATAKTTTTTDSNIYSDIIRASYRLDEPSYELRINFDDIINPVIKIHFDQFKDQIEKVTASLNVIIKRNAESTEDTSSEVIKKPFSLRSAGNKLEISPQDPYAKYNESSTSSGSSCLVMLTIVASLIGMLGFAVSCI